MTGYGYSEYQDDKIHITLEIKSYNNRYLDVIINLPPFLNPIEQEIRKVITGNSKRGRVEIYLRVRELEEDLELHLDKNAIKTYAESLKQLAQTAGIEEAVQLKHLLAFEGLLKSEKKRDIDAYRSKVLSVLEESISMWDASRIKEGKDTENDIRVNVSSIYEAIDLFEQKAGEMEENIKLNIQTRFEEVLGNQVDEQRMLSETAVLLVKYSINEEIIRLKGHLDSFIEAVSSGDAVGKKLDFICQEINREVNTIGSKSFVMEVNHKVVEVKDKLENVREQLRNVE
jgi:uncharacterized protein (TIGR00255 family)